MTLGLEASGTEYRRRRRRRHWLVPLRQEGIQMSSLLSPRLIRPLAVPLRSTSTHSLVCSHSLLRKALLQWIRQIISLLGWRRQLMVGMI